MALILFVAALPLQAKEQNQPLVSFDLSRITTNDAKATTKNDTLRIETGTKQNWPGVTIKAPAGRWDLSKYEYIKLDIKNTEAKPVTVFCRVDNPGADGRKNCVTDNPTTLPLIQIQQKH
jgi:hypothetical protein